MSRGAGQTAPQEPLAVLLLRGPLEGFELEDHARSMLAIPRVIALEVPRKRMPRWLRESAPLRQAKRLRFPGRVRLLVLYHPAQYPLARALRDRHAGAELWYVEPHASDSWVRGDDPELRDWDARARERATAILLRPEATVVSDEPLRARLTELEVISPYAFTPYQRRR